MDILTSTFYCDLIGFCFAGLVHETEPTVEIVDIHFIFTRGVKFIVYNYQHFSNSYDDFLIFAI